MRTSDSVVIFLLRDLCVGGAENLFVNLANHYFRSGGRPIVALVRKTGDLVGKLDSGIEVFELSGGRMLSSIFPLRELLRKLNPEMLVCTTEYINIVGWFSWMLCPEISTKLVIREATVLQKHLEHKMGFLGICILRLLSSLVYRYSNLTVFPSRASMSSAIDWLFLKPANPLILMNPVDSEEINQFAQQELPEGDYPPYYLAVQRLETEKNYELLLEAFSLFNKTRPEWKLVILGDGSKKHSLELLASDLGIRPGVVFYGYESNPYRWMKRAHGIVSTSLYEGFSNTLLEALFLKIHLIVTSNSESSVELMQMLGSSNISTPKADDLAALLDRVAGLSAPQYNFELPAPNQYLDALSKGFVSHAG